MSGEQVDARSFAETALYAQGWPSVNRDAITNQAIDVARYAQAALAAADAKCDARVAEIKREYDTLLERERKVAHELRAELDAARDGLEKELREKSASRNEWAQEPGIDEGRRHSFIVARNIYHAAADMVFAYFPAPPSVPAKESE